MEKEFIKKRSLSKEEIFKNKLDYFSNQIVDGLGKGIEPGILEQVVYLNLLGFYTTTSCEGHIDSHGYPFGYIKFGSPQENDSRLLSNTVFNEVRNRAFQLEKEKFPDFDGSSEKYTADIDDFFHKNMEEGLQNHPLYNDYLKETSEINHFTQLEKAKIINLVEEFKQSFPECQEDIYIDSELAMPNIYFTNKDSYALFNNDRTNNSTELRNDIHQKSILVMNRFNIFLKNKFEKMT